MEHRSSKLALRIVLGVLLTVAVEYQVRYTWDLIEDLSDQDHISRRPFVLGAPWPSVIAVRPEASEAGIKPGDRIVAIGGEESRGTSALSRALERSHSGQTLTVTVERDGRRFESAPIRLERRLLPANPVVRAVLHVMLYVVMPVLCIGLGFWVAFLRPRDPLAWLLLAVLLSFLHMVGGEVRLESWEPQWLRTTAGFYVSVARSGWPIWMLLFGLYFLKPLQFELRYPWVKWPLIVPLAATGIMQTVALTLSQDNFRLVEPVIELLDSVSRERLILAFASVSVFFVTLSRKWAGAADPDDRRRLKLLVLGATFSLTPMFLVLLWVLVANVPMERLREYHLLPLAAPMFFFPVTLTYVIVVERALDVRVVLRQGLQYTLARGGLRILQVALSVVAVLAAVTLALEPGRNRPQILSALAWGAVAVVLLQRIAGKLAQWIDRKFFREAYDAEQVLSELSDSVRTMVETEPLVETVARRLAEALHIARVVMLLRSNGSYTPAYALGYPDKTPAAIPATSKLAEALRQNREPVRVFFDDGQSWIHKAGLPPEEVDSLRLLDTRLLLPMAVKDKLLGFISLGPKRSEEAYSGSDIRLLKSVAAQTGLALENSHLTQAIAHEAAHRERLLLDLEIAREVQERLYPQTLPEVPGLDYAAACRPARAVGGDYYDFLALDSGEFGIAIGDVSGKGISAALLMASLQASLRSQAISAPPDLAALMLNMNRLTHAATASNRYATFFYGRYDPRTRDLAYVNAGHNAPLVARGGEVLRLEEGGPPIGLLSTVSYRQASVELMPDDMLVLFTDGVSDAMNSKDEEWGEDRLLAAMKANRQATAAGILRAIFEDAAAFTAGAPQHDDMTLIVVKIFDQAV